MNSLYSALSDIPLDVQDDAKEILNAMLTSSDTIGWDDKLQLIVDGRAIPKTNVSELVVHVLYPHDDRIEDPRGFNIFVQGLKDIGLEAEWVDNEVAKSVLESTEDDTGETSDDDDSDSDDDVTEVDENDETEVDERNDERSSGSDDDSVNDEHEDEMDSQ